MHRRIDFYAQQPHQMAEIVVERGTKDQRVYRAPRSIVLGGFHPVLTTTGLHGARADSSPRLQPPFQWHEVRVGPGAEVAIRWNDPGGILQVGTRSFSTYLFFINTKTRQPVGFQSTDIVD